MARLPDVDKIGGGRGGSGMQNLINVRDYAGSVQNGDWAPAFKEAIAASVMGGNTAVPRS
jgi:asparagine synthetase A